MVCLHGVYNSQTFKRWTQKVFVFNILANERTEIRLIRREKLTPTQDQVKKKKYIKKGVQSSKKGVSSRKNITKNNTNKSRFKTVIFLLQIKFSLGKKLKLYKQKKNGHKGNNQMKRSRETETRGTCHLMFCIEKS